MSDYYSFLEQLAGHAHSEGGWGYAPGQPPHLEPTCLGLLALALERDRYADLIDRGLKVLQASSTPEGYYRLPRGRQQAVWPTALALFTRAVLGASLRELQPIAARLLALKGRTPAGKVHEDLHDIDIKLLGWPWAEGNFSWAEPTAWACLALRRVGQGGHPRVEEGQRLLLDRTADTGGINYGNRKILGRFTEPIPGPTALMLLALQGRSDHPRIAASCTYLINAIRGCDDIEHLCWGRLALSTHRDKPGVAEALPEIDRAILAAQESRAATPYVRPAPLRIALTALAVAADVNNVFQLPAEMLNGTPEPLAPAHELQQRRSLGERINSWFRGLAVKAVGQLRPLEPKTAVHIARAPSYDADLAAIVQQQYEHFRAKVPLQGKRVVIKPNLVEYHRDKVINTHPNVVAAVIELCRKEGAGEIIVAEGPGHWRNVEYLVAASGLGDVLRKYNVPFVDLNHDEPVKEPNLGGLTGLEYLYLSRTVATAEVLISVPKLKTHHWAGATLSLKNLFGTLPGICYGWPKNELHWRGIDNSIVDIALTKTPNLAVVDGIIGMEGDGPLNGTAKPFGALIMGCDPLAVDATCCRLMKLNPEKVGYLMLGYSKKLGLLYAKDIEQLGEKIEALAQPFATVEHFKYLAVG